MKVSQRQERKPLGGSRVRTISPILALAVICSLAAFSGTSHAQITVKRPLSPEALAMHAHAKRPVAAAPTTSLELAATATAAPTTFNSDQGPGPGPIGPGPGCNLFPAPPSVGATVPLSYFGPPPSDTNRSLVGPVQLLDTGVVDAAHGTITIPLYLGHLKERKKCVVRLDRC